MTEDAKIGGSTTPLTGEQIDAVGGGLSCTADELTRLTGELKQAYENLIDFTSYVMERVGG